MEASRHGPFSPRPAVKVPRLSMDQKERLLMDIFLDESGECEVMLEKMFTRDTNESLFMLHRLMTNLHYNDNRRYAEEVGDFEYMSDLHARTESYRNEVAQQLETIRQLLAMANVPPDPRLLSVTRDDMRALLDEDQGRPESAEGLADELRYVFKENIVGTGESFKQRQQRYRRTLDMKTGSSGPQPLTLTTDDMYALLEDEEGRPESARGLADELCAVFQQDCAGTGESFKQRQLRYRRMVRMNSGGGGSSKRARRPY
jgi:hypothetical protein